MSLSKGQLQHFAGDLPSSDQVASYLYDSAGNALTSTLVSGKQALDVNMVNEIAVALDGVYDGVTNLNPDNAGLITHVRNAAPGDAHQTFRSTGGVATSDAVVAANVFGMDMNAFGMLFNGTTFDRMRSKNLGNVAVNDSASALQVTQDDVTGTAAEVLGTPLAGRREVTIQNLGTKKVFIGHTSGVTAADGLEIGPKSSATFKWDALVDIFMISESGTQDVRFVEAA